MAALIVPGGNDFCSQIIVWEWIVWTNSKYLGRLRSEPELGEGSRPSELPSSPSVFWRENCFVFVTSGGVFLINGVLGRGGGWFLTEFQPRLLALPREFWREGDDDTIEQALSQTDSGKSWWQQGHLISLLLAEGTVAQRGCVPNSRLHSQ